LNETQQTSGSCLNQLDQIAHVVVIFTAWLMRRTALGSLFASYVGGKEWFGL